jgi:hypothetical protein
VTGQNKYRYDKKGLLHFTATDEVGSSTGSTVLCLIFEMIENDDLEEQYGVLEHPSGIVLPKILRSLIPLSQLDDEEGDSIHWEPKDREWTVEELYHAINQTSQQLLNVQSQILNGEDYYINNLSSISIYNSSKNFDASFLDSRNEGNSIAGTGPSAAVGGGIISSHRWFSSSFTDVSPYQHTVQRPDLPKPVQPILKSVPIAASAITVPAESVKHSKPSDEVTSLSSSASIVVTEAKDVKDSESVASKALLLEDKVVATKPPTRKSERAPHPQPERRTTKRRRKSAS